MIVMDAVIAALILSCTTLQTANPPKPGRIEQLACIERVTSCAKKKTQSTTYGESVLDCAKELQ